MTTIQTIGVLTPILDGFYNGNLLLGISKKAKEYDCKIIIFGTSARNYSHTFSSAYVDAWIVIMDAVDNQYIENLRKKGKPIIGINTTLDCDYIVSIDNEKMMDLAVHHLIEHGHERIAYVGDNYFFDAKERFTSYLRSLKKHNIEYGKSYFYNALEKSPFDIVTNMIDNKLPCTAIISVNDFVARELVDMFHRFNVNVPNDVAIIGFDDSPTSVTSKPSLTTFHLPIREIGEQAVSAIINLSETTSDSHDNGHYINKYINVNKIINVKSKFMLRESCGCKIDSSKEITDGPSDTIKLLSNMIDRNFNLGQMMQASNYKNVLDLKWLIHTPFQKALLGLWDPNDDKQLKVNKYNTNFEIGKYENIALENCLPINFPPKKTLFNEEFMDGEHAIIIIPIVQEDKELGVLGFVGLQDIFTFSQPLNTTYQLANFFGAALLKEAMYEENKSYSHQLEIISNIMYDGIWTLDYTSKKISIRGGINHILGYSFNGYESTLNDMFNLIHPKDLLAVKKSFQSHIEENTPFEVECRFRHAEGHFIWMYITGQTQYDPFGNASKVLGSIMDISIRKKNEERINELAYSDKLTGLANRFYFEEKLIEILDEANKNKEKVALFLFDLDRFKFINDSYGHQAGDRLLRYVAERVRSLTTEQQLFARLGGDEFVIVMPNIKSIDSAYLFGSKLVTCLSEPFIDDEREYLISSSIGISLHPDDSKDAETMMLHADLAMYHAKSLGRNRLQLFNEQMRNNNSQQLNFEYRLQKAIDKREFTIQYQPIYEFSTGKYIGVEALLRWESPELGLVNPQEFIPFAEKTGFIIPIGEFVLREACFLKQLLNANDLPFVKVFIKISSKQLNHVNFVSRVEKIINEIGCSPEDFFFEMTESTMMDDTTLISRNIKKLINLGLTFTMDDFGTGYSSLSLLKNLPVQIIKINKSFIDNIATDHRDRAIVKSITDMAHTMSLKIVADGIETVAQVDILKELNVNYAQGLRIGQPLANENVIRWFHSKSNR
ncbi:EAL domain-containing protein [Evansella sp. AB-rgal1]|uniref:EAL domain-containing protein n=1 Tax=Evansella sp. AB-rgal1 TaxID=3242696 RepID=UPI00359D4832